MNYLVKKYALLIAIIMMNAQAMFAQSSLTRISGNVKDENGEVLPYTTVRLKDTSTGCITDYNGNFSFNAKADGQTLVVSCIGYKDYEVKLSSRTSYPLKIVLRSSAYDMEEVVIKPTRERYQKKGNPAVELITEIINRRNTDNPFNNEFVSRDRYETFLIALDNFTEEKQQQATFRNFPFLKEYVDTSQVSGKPILNVSSRELAATDYFQRRPSRQKQKVHGREWIGIEDFLPDEEVRASVEATLKDVDLFNDKVMIMRNEFVSPFSDIATTYYRFYLQDTLVVEGEKCVDLAFVPRNLQSFGFTGHLYITVDSTHFVKWVQMNVPYDINLNFVEYMNVEQKFDRDSEHPRLLTYECITAELKLYDFIDGIYGRREVFYSGYKFNDDVDREPFTHQEPIIETEDAMGKDSEFWAQYRSMDDGGDGGKTQDVEEMISRLREVPLYYWTEQLINLIFSGFVPLRQENNPFYIGPINTILSYNGMEKLRIKLGGMTTANLNPHLFGTGYLIYGLDDNRFKYYGRLEYSFPAKKEQWNEFPVHSLRLQYEDDIYQYGQQYLYTNKDNALLSLKRLPDNMIGYVRNAELTYTLERHSGFSFTGVLRNRVNEATRFIPMERSDGSGPVNEIMQTELEIGLRYAPHEKFVQHKWNRKSKTPEHPVFTLNHTFSKAGLLGSDYSIQHTELSYRQRIMAAPVGYFDVMLRAGKIWGQAPYPLLIIPNANLSYTYRKETFETMTPMEFVMDQHLTWDVVYYMNGLIFNRTPLLKKLKLREVLYCRGTWGSLSDKNNPAIDTSGNIFFYPTDRSKATGTVMTEPFVEIGAGVENIFKLMSINWFKRMTYKNSPDVDQWGLRIAVHLQY
jgi:hypothetical protein